MSIIDAKLGTLVCTPDQPATLDLTESLSCTGTYLTTQADVDAGKVDNTANASSTQVAADPASVSVPATQNPHLNLTKVATETSFSAAGVTLHYTLVATNNGNVTLTNVSIIDTKLGTLVCTPAQPATLAPLASLSCTGTYLTTQADMNAGKVDNTANASSNLVAADPACVSVPATQIPHLGLTKVATEASFNSKGETLHYTLVATNDGNVTLTLVSIIDAKLGTLVCTPAQPATLAPLASLSCTGTYVTKQTDVNAGKVDNTANAGGTFGVIPVAALPASESVPAARSPHLSLTKAATETSFSAAGVTLHYTLEATNDGNVTLTDVSITDAKLGTLDCTPSQGATLEPPETLSCTGTYLTTQADVDAGKVDNTANANGMFGTTQVVALPASVSVPSARSPHLGLTKVATEASFGAAGVTLHYTLVATNDGNVTLTDVSIIDTKLGTLVCTPAQPATLAPLASLSCTGTYLTTQADVNAGKVDNTANAGGTFGVIPVVALPASVSVPAILGSALTIIKTATPAIYDYAGQVISYSFKVQNTGNVTLSAPFIVFDDKTANEGCPATPTSLNPGEFITCTASYTILLSDMSSGTVINSAYATGKLGETTITSNPDSETITAKKILTYTFLPFVVEPYPIGVQVLPVTYSYESHETLFVIGEVLNNTSNSLRLVEVNVNLFNNFGKLVGTGDTILWPLDLPAWKRGCFNISTDPPPNWLYYQFEAPTHAMSDTSPGLSIINDSGSYSPAKDYSIIGQVRNDGNQRSNSVYVSGTLYTASGVPVGCNHVKVNSNDLTPGQISSFSIKYLGYYRDYSDVAYYRLRVAGEMP